MTEFKDFMKEELKDPEFREYWESTQALRDVSKALIEARAKLGLTQKELSKLSGVPQADISRLESLDANPNLKTLNKIASSLGMVVRVQLENKNDI